MFNVTLYRTILPITVQDFTGITSSGASSTLTEVYLNPAITTQDWIGRYIVFISGNLKGYAAQIAGYGGADPNTNVFNLAHELNFAPDTGSKFKIIEIESDGSMELYDPLDLTKYVDDVSFSTDIAEGYSRGTISLKRNSHELANLYSDLLGQYIVINDEAARNVYQGIIAGVSLQGNGGTITCMGIGQTLKWFPFYGFYPIATTTTAPYVIRQILQLCPYVDKDYQIIDNNDEWNDLQEGIGGIGPLDFTQSNITCQSALDRILKSGNYGYLQQATQEAFLQIWDWGQPYLKFGNSDPGLEEADWLITNANMEYGKDNIELIGDVADSYSWTNASYNDSEGNTIETSGYVNLQFLEKYGIKKREISTGEERLLTINILQVAAYDKSYIAGPGKLALQGNIRSAKVDSYNSPAYMLRAGDIILLEDPLAGAPAFQNSLSSPAIAQVGNTSYSNGIMRIGLTKIKDVSTIFKNQISVETV